MKQYLEPTIDLLYVANEDVLTNSDPFGDDMFPNND